MARDVTRPVFPLVAFLLLFGVPLASAQAPAVSLQLTATPTGAWESDGFLHEPSEDAAWAVNATVTFSNTATCAQPTTVTLELVDSTSKTAASNVTPAQAAIEVPAGGGSRSVEAVARVQLPDDALGGEPVSMRLHGVVGACPSPVGTSPRGEANATLTVTALFRPRLFVQYENRSAAGVFNFTLNSGANGPMLVGAKVTPVAGAADQPTTVPSQLALGPGEFTGITVTFPEKRPGRYEVLLVGRFGGNEPERHLSTEFVAVVEIPEPVVIRETKNAPGFDAGFLCALAVGAWLRRRI